MKYDASRHGRRSIRLRGRDYARPGLYFVTLVTKEREELLHERSNRRIVEDAWRRLAQYPHVQLDTYVVMPNHLHGIVRLVDPDQGGSRAAPTPSKKHKPLGELIGVFKTVSTRRINRLRFTPGEPVWQRGFYERVLRTDELYAVRQYIRDNPKNWPMDTENPSPSRTV